MSDFAERLRAGDQLVGYWVTLDAPPATERIAMVGYDYLCVDAQHGLMGYRGMRDALLAVDAAPGEAVGLVRVEANDPVPIGRALDAGATGVIVPLVSSAAEAAAAVAAARYPPHGVRSFGPTRSGLRIGPDPVDANASTVVLAMIETADGLAAVEEIAATQGLDGLYIGPSDLMLAVGGARPGDPDKITEREAAIERILAACRASGIAPGVHTDDGATAAHRLAQGFTVVTLSCDVVHLQEAAAEHLRVARGA